MHIPSIGTCQSIKFFTGRKNYLAQKPTLSVVLLQLATKISLFTHLGSFQYASLRSLPLHVRNLYFQFQQNKTNGQMIMIFWHKRSGHDKNMHIASASVREQVAFDDNWWDFYKMFQNSKISDILLEYQHESSLGRCMGILTPKAVFLFKSYQLPLQVCQSNYHAIVKTLL